MVTRIQDIAAALSQQDIDTTDFLRLVFVPLFEELERVNKNAAAAFRDAIWHKNGKWHGVGLGAIPVSDLTGYAIELERMARNGEKLTVCEYKINRMENMEND